METLQDEEKILKFKNLIGGGTSSVMGYRHVVSDGDKKILYVVANILFGWAKSQSLPYEKNEPDRNVTQEDI